MINYKKKQYLKASLIIGIICVFIFFIFLIMLKYEIEGEKKEELPYFIEQISVVSTADGIPNLESTEYLWSGEFIQVNDIYMKIAKNQENNVTLQNVIIENIEIIAPKRGSINFTRITKNEDTSNNYILENISKYNFSADKSTSLENLTIANQGGVIGFRATNNNLGTYNFNGEEINYDGRILNIENIANEEIKFKIKFDVLIETKDGIKYKTNVELELPVGDILTNGVEIEEYNDIQEIVYKRC